MKVMPIRYVADVAVSARFYAALGLIPGDSSRSGNWTELNGSGGMLALHAARAAEQDRPGRIELSFETQELLEDLAARLTAPASRRRRSWMRASAAACAWSTRTACWCRSTSTTGSCIRDGGHAPHLLGSHRPVRRHRAAQGALDPRDELIDLGLGVAGPEALTAWVGAGGRRRGKGRRNGKGPGPAGGRARPWAGGGGRAQLA